MAGGKSKTNFPKDSKSEDQDKDDNVVSMLEILEEEEQLQDDASAVLGGSDANNCTYDRGYIPRQALYACATCSTEGSEEAGFCLACSYECHEGHDLLELYTKRNFRCDCGNSKFGDLTCKLRPGKEATNPDNQYNQNFKGTYCVCERPYPDPEDEVDDEMIQCIICEDWYHSRHLGCAPEQSYEEMICGGCLKKNNFLFAYAASTNPVNIEKDDENPDVDVSSPKRRRRSRSGSQPKTSPKNSPGGSSVAAGSSSGQPPCGLAPLQQAGDIKTPDGAVYWPQGWRKRLCKCSNCMATYSSKGVGYLVDETDTIGSYEEQGKASRSAQVSDFDRGMEALSSMGRVQQVEMIHGYNDLKTELKDYLKHFADNKKVVREEDIKEFFSSLSARKRKSGSNMQYFCK